MEYSGKRVLITGGAGQAGRAIAEAYARLGAAVILADKDYGVERFVTERLRPLSPGSRFIHCDLALTSACENLTEGIFEREGDIEVLVHCAGAPAPVPLTEAVGERWDYAVNSDLRAPLLIVRDWLRNRRKRGRLNEYGRFAAVLPGSEAAGAEAAAVRGGLEALVRSFEESFPAAMAAGALLPAGCAAPKELARACLLLTDEANTFLGGQCLTVAGRDLCDILSD